MELDISSENDAGESNMGGSDSSDVEIENTCLKCNKGGKLLICCGTGCAICLHDECIPRKPKYDEEGNFYCPYCWYKIHQARALELKKMALLAKKALRDFMDSKHLEVGDDREKRSDRKADGDDLNIRRPVVGERNCCEHLNRTDVDDEVRNGTEEVEKDHQNNKNVEGDHSKVGDEHEKISETRQFEVVVDHEGMEQEQENGNEQVADKQNAEILQDIEQKETLNGHRTEEEIIVDGALRGSAEVEPEALKISNRGQVREEKEEEVHKDAPAANVSGGDAASDVPEMSVSDDETIAVRRSCAKQRNNQNADSLKKSSVHPHNTSAEEARNHKAEVSPMKKSRQPQPPAKKL